MSLSMLGHIDDVFTSSVGTRTPRGGSYVDGVWVSNNQQQSTHRVNIQPLSLKQIINLGLGGERIEDYRNVWVNDQGAASVSPSDVWTFQGLDGRFKVTQLDNRVSFGRAYCKFVAVRIDE